MLRFLLSSKTMRHHIDLAGHRSLRPPTAKPLRTLPRKAASMGLERLNHSPVPPSSDSTKQSLTLIVYARDTEAFVGKIKRNEGNFSGRLTIDDVNVYVRLSLSDLTVRMLESTQLSLKLYEHNSHDTFYTSNSTY